eukprot:3278444-Alexandrium_andersonii.AAC.1
MERSGRNLLSKLVWLSEPGSGLDTRLRQQAGALRRARQLSAKQALESKVQQQQFVIEGLTRQ